MNASKNIAPQISRQAIDSGMKKPVIVSVGLHVLIVVLGTIGLPFLSVKKEPLEMAITVEMVELSDISQTNVVAPPKEVKEPKPEPKPTPPPEPPKPVYNKAAPEEVAPEPDLLTPKPPEVEEIPEPPKPEEIKQEEKPKPKPPAPKPRNKPKPPAPPKPKQEEKKPEEKKEPEPDISSLLNSVLNENPAPQQQTQDETTDQPSEPTQISQIARMSDKLTRSEQDDLNRGVQPCWNVNAGGKFAEELKVSLQVSLNPDMTVRDVRILDQQRYNSDTAFRAAADNARRALLNPTCNKLRLPQEKYEEWKVFTYHFDPSQML